MIILYLIILFVCWLWLLVLFCLFFDLYKRPENFYDWKSIHDAETQELPLVMVRAPVAEQVTQPVRSVISRRYVPGEVVRGYHRTGELPQHD